MDIRWDGCAYGIIYIGTYGWTDRQAGRLSNKVGRTYVRNYVRMYIRTDGQRDRQVK